MLPSSLELRDDVTAMIVRLRSARSRSSSPTRGAEALIRGTRLRDSEPAEVQPCAIGTAD
jgi:hypothetical protein